MVFSFKLCTSEQKIPVRMPLYTDCCAVECIQIVLYDIMTSADSFLQKICAKFRGPVCKIPQLTVAKSSKFCFLFGSKLSSVLFRKFSY